ncbi:sigma-54-dependent Fis family transcriptional regulator, partial [bacterium]|nr:sigma-54-dependent Fis family transcriptional regulator [bacterium]
MENKILIVDDEKNTRQGIARFLKSKNFGCELADNGNTALEILSDSHIDIVLTDLRMPAMGGMELIKKIKEISKDIIVIVLTAYGSVQTAVEALKLGADDFLTKPINLEKLYITINRITENINLEEENKQLRIQLDDKFGFENIIGNCEAIQKVFDMVRQVAPSRASVLIQGESGTGKELIARAIHQLSPRSSYPFVAVHCASLVDNLLESELFGHEKGSFTGAIAQRIGRFEQANKGTLFLDEVGEISMAVQVKLLRVLQEQVFERVGAAKSITTDIRLITATNKLLEEEIKKNKFREDLYYRLNVVTIKLPPLRDRYDDIPLLISHYLKKFKK